MNTYLQTLHSLSYSQLTKDKLTVTWTIREQKNSAEKGIKMWQCNKADSEIEGELYVYYTSV